MIPLFHRQCTAKSGTTTGLDLVSLHKNWLIRVSIYFGTPKSHFFSKGTCLTSTECSDKSGNVDGSCASGFGVCCTFK